MNDQEKAREELDEAIANYCREHRSWTINAAVDAVLSADPRVIAEAMGGDYLPDDEFEPESRAVIVLPQRKVEDVP